MATKFLIGDKVRLSFGNRIVTGTVVEDRGRIGVGGRQLFRIVVKTGDEERALELPAEKLRFLKMDIEEIVQRLNDESDRFEFGRLQEIRKEHLGLQRRPNRKPFGRKAISRDRTYAYHVGGHDELQFNIGFDCYKDKEILRWGVAISLQKTRAILDVKKLFPKIDKLNKFICRCGDDYLNGFLMWHWHEGRRSDDRSPEVVPSRLYTDGVFIFLGKHEQVEVFDADTILRDFDRLLTLYKYVEFGMSDFPIPNDTSGFTFRPTRRLDNSERRYWTEAMRETGQIEVSLRHRQIQDALYQELRAELGNHVEAEYSDGADGRVDLIAQRGADLEFYEIKIGPSARLCIRQALGQLMEYGFWLGPGAAGPAKLFVVGEPPLDGKAEKFLQSLREKFKIPIYYRQVVIGN